MLRTSIAEFLEKKLWMPLGNPQMHKIKTVWKNEKFIRLRYDLLIPRLRILFPGSKARLLKVLKVKFDSRVDKNCNNLKKHCLGRKPVSIIYYNRTGTSNKRPTQNYKATLGHVNWGVVYSKGSYKIPLPSIMDPYIIAFFIFLFFYLCNQ